MSKFRIDGLRALEASLKELPKATVKRTLVKVLRERGQPMADAAAGNVTEYSGQLQESAAVSTKLRKRQARMQRGYNRDNPTFAQVYVGFNTPYEHMYEFGSVHHSPKAPMRKAWDSERAGVISGIKEDLQAAIDKAVQRRRRKLARNGG